MASIERESARANALDCARRAVEIDPFYKARLKFIAKPDGPDGDLADFHADPDFLAIVGPPSTSQ